MELRFGNKVLKIGNRSSIIVGDITNLVPVLEKVKQAVEAGELDDALKVASKRRNRRVKKNGKPVASMTAPVVMTVPAPVVKPAGKSAK